MFCRTLIRSFTSRECYRTPIVGLLYYRQFHDEFSSPAPLEKPIPRAVQGKYKIFKDEDSPEIFDVEEEKQRVQEEKEQYVEYDAYADINLQRGIQGVFEIEDLVDVLRRESAEDIVVCSVPKEIKYVDYICIVTGRSYRHMKAIASFVRKVYKMKRRKGDILPRIEGENSTDWMAIDLGNIALHVFSSKARQSYDLESLWSVGPEYDKEFNKPEDPLIELFQKHSMYLNDLKPKES